MPKLVSLNNRVHKDIKIDTNKIEVIGSSERMIPVVLSEFLKLCVQYPIVFTKDADTGKFVCVVLLGFEQSENLFWLKNQWDGIYVPLNITRQPFFIGKEDLDKEQAVICIDINSPCISTDNGESLFDAQGQDTAYLGSAKSMLAQLIEGEKQNFNFINTLLNLDLIMPLALDITFADDKTQRVQGIYTIDEEKLDQLSKDEMLVLHQQKYLKPIYTMVSSLGHIYSLIQRKNTSLMAQ
ncbi:SapC family protein [Agarilytica rhodophyticola]|uniref:SapC family protein n=1 Tax=Agarilytica rhodophyticola TaxID=1737490 RepID=UPI000B344F6A|nr:SapC family protein [Agarilytica rhodophyticola]